MGGLSLKLLTFGYRCARARPGTGATRWWRAAGASASTTRTAAARRAATTSAARTRAGGTPAASAQTAGPGTTVIERENTFYLTGLEAYDHFQPPSAPARRALWVIPSSLAASPGGARIGKLYDMNHSLCPYSPLLLLEFSHLLKRFVQLGFSHQHCHR